ncbi:hypothetical protein LshimejAT787_1601250 [Lyophyllum shimeji]|uniref:Uncharacterized protein n=1 Tax=Lyophyllum shimeji TaxID=47721 RepID=A0A9P3PY68_LYOSH|nr:hypothetical protein LshimejAT787_1601250 [Lyophyllum shimeji]
MKLTIFAAAIGYAALIAPVMGMPVVEAGGLIARDAATPAAPGTPADAEDMSRRCRPWDWWCRRPPRCRPWDWWCHRRCHPWDWRCHERWVQGEQSTEGEEAEQQQEAAQPDVEE